MKKKIIILAASLLSAQAFAAQEIPDTSINEFAIASMENNEAVIRYNPEYCETQNSEVCEFFISHEHAHIALKHTLGGEYTTEEKYAADCWVTQNAPEELSKSAYTYFTNKTDEGSSERANNITNCSNNKTSSPKEQLSSDELSNEKQSKSRFNHYRADAVFANLERRFPWAFPRSFWGSKYGNEYRSNEGYIGYAKHYRNGSALIEYRGYLYFRVGNNPYIQWGLIRKF